MRDATRSALALREKPFVSEAIQHISASWSPIVARYAARLQPGVTLQPKAIKDSVWGMVDLSGPEVVLIDSPPLQRLRRIRQLGLCFLTFPTATHSRFEHTIGVVHQSERMVRALIARSRTQRELLSSALPTIRLAALLHDVGHLPLSHVTERYYSAEECTDENLLGWTTRFRNEIRKHFESPKISLSECLSIAFILLPEFWDLIVATGYSDQQIDDALALIAGIPPSAELAFAKQVVSDVLDADKLDYMFRDARMTGVPLSVDLEILLYKLKCYQTPLTEAPASMQKFFGSNGIAHVIGTSPGGFGHAKDVILARALLHERVYHHHKVLAAERIALEVMAKARPHPAEFLCEDDRFFSSSRSSKLSSPARYYAMLLENRTLPRRLFVASYGFLISKDRAVERIKTPAEASQEAAGLPEEEQVAFDSFGSLLARSAERTAFALKIKRLAQGLSRQLNQGVLPKLSLWIDPAHALEPLTLDLQVRTPDGRVLDKGVFREQAAAFPTYTSSTSYFYFSGIKDEQASILFIAVERTLYQTFGLWFGSDAAHHAKQSWSKIEATKRNIEGSFPDWFSGCRRLRPLSLVAASASNEARLQQLVQRFQEYSVPGGKIDLRRIQNFLDQFPENLILPMIEVMENISFLDRKRLGLEFSKTLESENLLASSLVPLSQGLHKSSAMLPYMMSDSSEPRLSFMSFDSALSGQGDITFYEDYICSGRQPRATLQIWFGLPPDVTEPGLAAELTEEQKAKLRSKRLHFRFVFGTTWGIANLEKLITKLSLNADVGAAIIHERAQSQIHDFLQPDIAVQLENFLRKVGVGVLRSTKQKESPMKWTDAMCEERCFGYSGNGLLVASSMNCPTSTITALWKSGDFEDMPWLPLFARRHEGTIASTEEPLPAAE